MRPCRNRLTTTLTTLAALARSAALSVAVVATGAACAQGVLAPPPQGAPQNALATAVANVGLTSCASALERLSSLGVQGTRANDVLVDWDRKRPATSSVFSLIGMEYANGGGAMTVTSVPEADGTCSLSAERITVAPYTCASVAQNELRGTQRTQLLPNFAVYTDPKDRTSSVSLIDSPPGCLVIRRYVEFNWKDTSAGAAPAAVRK